MKFICLSNVSDFLFKPSVCIHIRYVRSSLVVVDFFIVKSESKRSSGTHLAAEDMEENIQAIFVYILYNFESNNGKMFEYLKFRI